MKKCKVCGELTNTVFNINLKATPICEECARRIFLQQATWYAKQEFKNLALPQVSESEDVEREASCKHSDWTDLYYSSGDYYGRYCNDCGEFFE